MPKPSVLFVCVKNGGKSQMAAALMRHIAGDAIDVHSAGTQPGGSLNEESRRSCEAVGARFDGEFPKPVDTHVLNGADRVIVIGTEAVLPPHTNTHVEVWEIDEPSLRGIEGAERMDLIRDELLQRTRQLAGELRAEEAGR